MGEGMLTKWEWIEEKCKENGLKESGKIAKKIDDLLKKIYGRKHTEEWIRMYKAADGIYLVHELEGKKSKLAYVFEVANTASYCIGCIETKKGKKRLDKELPCSRCKFGEQAGWCGSEGSLFYEFTQTFEKEYRRCADDMHA